MTSLPFGPIAELTRTSATPSTLVSNTGQSASANADITQRYAVGFRLGDHGQGYEISSVSIELAAVPSSLTVSLWSGGVQEGLQPNTATKLFDFADPSSFAVGLNKFTAPAGAFAYQGVNYFIVLSGFGTTLSIKETTSDDEDTGGETGAVIYDKAAVRALSDTGPWGASGSRASVLRLAVEGSQRARASWLRTTRNPKSMIRALMTLLTTSVLIKRSSRSATRLLSESNSEQRTATSSAVFPLTSDDSTPTAAASPTRSTCARVPGRAPCSSA